MSAEEIFRDRKILKREAFLNLSKSSYLISKVFILIAISAIQSILFVLIANTILDVKGMYFAYWLALFSTAVFANILGLNISASFNSAVTIYIIIPLLMIPMMVLSGAMFSFDKLNRTVGSVNKVPLVAEFIVTRWSYEALMVHQFKDNMFERTFYPIDKRKSQADFRQVYLMPELETRFNLCFDELSEKVRLQRTAGDLKSLYEAIQRERRYNPDAESFNLSLLTPERFNREAAGALEAYIENMDMYYSKIVARYNACVEELYEKGKVEDYVEDLEALRNIVETELTFNFEAPEIDLKLLIPQKFKPNVAEQLKVIIDLIAERYPIAELQRLTKQCVEEMDELSQTARIEESIHPLQVIKNEIIKEMSIDPSVSFDISLLTPQKFDMYVADSLKIFLNAMTERYMNKFTVANNEMEQTIQYLIGQDAQKYTRIKNAYQNEHLGEILKKSFEKNKILEFEDELVQQIDPIYKDPSTTGLINVRTHFFAPRKYFAGQFFDTYWFNICLIWVYSALLYILLYFDGLKKLMNLFGRIRFKK